MRYTKVSWTASKYSVTSSRIFRSSGSSRLSVARKPRQKRLVGRQQYTSIGSGSSYRERWITLYRRTRLSKRVFDVQKMLCSDSRQKLTNQTIKNTGSIIAANNFEPIAELYRVLAKSVEATAKSMEACDCHQDLFVPGIKRKRRMCMMKKSGGHELCCMCGRRIP